MLEFCVYREENHFYLCTFIRIRIFIDFACSNSIPFIESVEINATEQRKLTLKKIYDFLFCKLLTPISVSNASKSCSAISHNRYRMTDWVYSNYWKLTYDIRFIWISSTYSRSSIQTIILVVCCCCFCNPISQAGKIMSCHVFSSMVDGLWEWFYVYGISKNK